MCFYIAVFLLHIFAKDHCMGKLDKFLYLLFLRMPELNLFVMVQDC